MHTVIILALIYAAYHFGHAHSTWRRARRKRLPWWRKVWVSVPGPFNTRISRRI